MLGDVRQQRGGRSGTMPLHPSGEVRRVPLEDPREAHHPRVGIGRHVAFLAEETDGLADQLLLEAPGHEGLCGEPRAALRSAVEREVDRGSSNRFRMTRLSRVQSDIHSPPTTTRFRKKKPARRSTQLNGFSASSTLAIGQASSTIAITHAL